MSLLHQDASPLIIPSYRSVSWHRKVEEGFLFAFIRPMKKILQIMQACDGWEAVFFSYDGEELFCEPVICWALVSERPYVGRNVHCKPCP
jgi:hypothetical protein